MKELYIFDFDGTLVDSYRDSIKYFNITLEQFNLPTFDLDVEGLDYQIFREFIHEQIIGIEEEFMKKFTLNYKDSPQVNTYLYDGIIDVLQELQNRKITLAICSNREQNNLEELVNDFLDGIDFKYISGTVNEEHCKPDPYRINEIIRKENIEKDKILYFGDKVADIEAAKAACIDMVLVTYGQGNDEAYSDSYPLKLIDNPKEILDL
ncbi:MAG: HAD family hydrolase [Methanosphaera stadtmanae]|nr:HAD family hydrolase [Methanosphaera stadtmanae]